MAQPSFTITPGMRLGRLTVLFEVPKELRVERGRLRSYRCRCDCGIEKVVAGSYMRTAPVRSCGCLGTEVRKMLSKHQFQVKHGLSRHPVYRVWKGIRNRCLNPDYNYWKDYGGRGITICDEWANDPAAFIAWALANGWAPGLEIDREDNDGNYTPGNCRFVTRLINQRNKRRRLNNGS